MWYKDDKFYKGGSQMFWLPNIPASDLEGTWQCQVNCKGGPGVISKKIKIANQHPNFQLQTEEVPEIEKSSFSITNNLLGAGQ